MTIERMKEVMRLVKCLPCSPHLSLLCPFHLNFTTINIVRTLLTRGLRSKSEVHCSLVFSCFMKLTLFCFLRLCSISTPSRLKMSRNENIVYSTDTPEEYWCQVPELENLTTIAHRKFLSIPFIEVRRF